jgi:hypothetical protein
MNPPSLSGFGKKRSTDQHVMKYLIPLIGRGTSKDHPDLDSIIHRAMRSMLHPNEIPKRPSDHSRSTNEPNTSPLTSIGWSGGNVLSSVFQILAPQQQITASITRELPHSKTMTVLHREANITDYSRETSLDISTAERYASLVLDSIA